MKFTRSSSLYKALYSLPPHPIAVMSHPTTDLPQSSLQPHASQPRRKPSESPYYYFVSRLILALILLFAVFSITSWIAWLILDPQCPLVTLNSLSVSNSTLYKSHQLKANYNLQLSIKNPNKKVSLYMDDFRVSLLYKAADVSATSMNPVYLEKMSEQIVHAVGEMVVNEWSRRSMVNIGVEMNVMTRFRANLLTRRRLIGVTCINLGVDFIKGGEKDCSVHFM